MAIKISYGDVSGYAKLGVLAGKAKADTTAMQLQAAADRQVMQIKAQRESQVRAQKHQVEMQEFDAYMDNIKYQSSEAWELEKMELRSRHDFEMLEGKREMDFMSELQREQRQKQEMDMKLKAIKEAEHLSDREKEIATIRVQSGVGVQADRLTKENPLAALYGERTGQAIDPEVQRAREQTDRAGAASKQEQALQAETQRKADNLRKILPTLDAGSQAQVRRIIDSGDPDLINELYRSDALRKAVIEKKEKPSNLQASLDLFSKTLQGPIGWPK